jgi:4-hydroxy-2-oxoheptanedioate aldolase
MRANHVRQRLAAGEPSVGTWLALPSPEAAEYVSTLGFDWLVVDTEHNAVDIRTLSQMFGVIAGAGVAPMVRIPWNSAENIKRVLDAGAWGFVVPMVNSREEAEAVVEATYFPPRGNRSIGGSMTGIRFGTSGGDYLKHADDELLVVIQIEHIKGVEAADEILSVPGIHACFIGPNDLAASMGVGLGVPLECEDPRMIEAIEHIRTTCLKYGVAPGVHTSGTAGINQRIAEGFQFLAMASELRYLLSGLSDDLKASNWTASARGQVGVPAAAGSAVRY